MQVSKWGNSLAVRLPKALVEALALKPGDELRIIDASEERLVVEKSDGRACALAHMAARAWVLPSDYRFDRDEANER